MFPSPFKNLQSLQETSVFIIFSISWANCFFNLTNNILFYFLSSKALGLSAEVATGGVLQKKILQISQENTVLESLFNKVVDLHWFYVHRPCFVKVPS